MSVCTKNKIGTITISEEAIAKVVAKASLDCYGIVELVSKDIADSLSIFLKLKGKSTRGVVVTTTGVRIFIDVYVVVKFGVSISAVAESLKEAIKYKVECFTGMIVDNVNVNVAGVKL